MARSEPFQLDERPVFFFDVDDCLYSQSLGIRHLMRDRLEKFMMENLSVSKDEAADLMEKYCLEHDLVVVGLHKNHHIDPMSFNEQNDNALPLDNLLFPDKELRAVLQRFDPTKIKLWLFTNAHITHGQRVVRLLGIDDLFEGITYCDYSDGQWTIKPKPETFAKAEREAGVRAHQQCYLVDDSIQNCAAAAARGWHVARIVHSKLPEQNSESKPPFDTISSIAELHEIFPEFSR